MGAFHDQIINNVMAQARQMMGGSYGGAPAHSASVRTRYQVTRVPRVPFAHVIDPKKCDAPVKTSDCALNCGGYDACSDCCNTGWPDAGNKSGYDDCINRCKNKFPGESGQQM